MALYYHNWLATDAAENDKKLPTVQPQMHMLTHMAYDKVAEGCGAKGLRVSEHDKMNDVLAEAVKISREGAPVLVNALLGKTDFRKGSISM